MARALGGPIATSDKGRGRQILSLDGRRDWLLNAVRSSSGNAADLRPTIEAATAPSRDPSSDGSEGRRRLLIRGDPGPSVTRLFPPDRGPQSAGCSARRTARLAARRPSAQRGAVTVATHPRAGRIAPGPGRTDPVGPRRHRPQGPPVPFPWDIGISTAGANGSSAGPTSYGPCRA